MNSAVDIKKLQLQDKGLLSVYLRNMTNLQRDRSVFRKVKGVAAYSVALPVPVRKRLHGPVFIAGGKIGTAEDIEQTAVILHIQGILAGCRAVNSLDRLDPDLAVLQFGDDGRLLIDDRIQRPEFLGGAEKGIEAPVCRQALIGTGLEKAQGTDPTASVFHADQFRICRDMDPAGVIHLCLYPDHVQVILALC